SAVARGRACESCHKTATPRCHARNNSGGSASVVACTSVSVFARRSRASRRKRNGSVRFAWRTASQDQKNRRQATGDRKQKTKVRVAMGARTCAMPGSGSRGMPAGGGGAVGGVNCFFDGGGG